VNHYPHHIGDFDKATRHLTRLERSIYRDLIELYYDTEAMLPLDSSWICRKIIARTDEEATAVEQALNEFFEQTPEGWYHERCEVEIEKFRANSSQKAQAGKASAAARAAAKLLALNGRSTGDETDVKQPSNGGATNQNRKPVTNKEANASLGDSANPPAKTRALKKCPKDFELNDKRLAWLAENAPLVNGPAELDKFKDYTFNRSIVDWDGAWRNWMRKAQGDAAKEANRTAIRTHLNGTKQNLYAGAAAAIYDGAEHV
jgi:uncharacterized protein YdaU (DUF1376 family)